VDEYEERSVAGRWLVVSIIMLGLAGWTAFTLYERFRPAAAAPAASAQPAQDDRVEGFVAAARKHLAKGEIDQAQEQLHKASGLAEGDLRVLEGLAVVEVMRAERTWWDLMFGKHDHEQRNKLLRKLDSEVERARLAVDRSLEKTKDEDVRARVSLAEQRLDAMQVLALGLHGDVDRARGALSARLDEHPQKKLIREFVETVGQPRPQTAEEEAGAEIKAPLAGGKAPAPGSHHYELDHEPKNLPKTPGELELPGGKERVETPVPEPAP
jgi:hypothetical protein